MYCENVVIGKNDRLNSGDFEKFLGFGSVLIQVFAASEDESLVKDMKSALSFLKSIFNIFNFLFCQSFLHEALMFDLLKAHSLFLQTILYCFQNMSKV